MSPVSFIRNALLIGVTFVGMINTHAQTCPNVLSNTTVTSSCNTGIAWTGGNLTIGTLTSGSVSISSSGETISGSGDLGFLENTSAGSISTGDNGAGIVGYGTITTLTNSGMISAGANGFGIANLGTIATLNNSGTISAGLAGIGNSMGTITSLNNSGIVSADSLGVYNLNGGTITTLTNSGTILGGVDGLANFGTITTLSNLGTISAGVNGTGIDNVNGTITTLNNSGTISAGDGALGIYNSGTITTLNNTGTISVGEGGIGIHIENGTITTLNNLGAISAGANGYGILDSFGGIITLNNAQGGNGASAATSALTYVGNLLANYNIIINSATHYGQLVLTDPEPIAPINFGIYGTPLITSRTYSSVLRGAPLPTGTSSGAYDNMTWSLVENGIDVYDLTFTGVSLMGTQQSLVNTANALAPVYAMQNATLVNSFTYDCTLFDVNNICISVGGRNTQVSAANGLNNTSALLIAAYRPHPNYRIGAYADQNLSVNNAGSTVNLTNSTPLIGVFGAWTQNQEGTGAEVRVSAAYGQKDTTITRQVVGLSEPGSGSSTLNSQGAQVTAKYGLGIMDKVIVSPYVGVRYTQNNMGGYTENASSTVTTPLTYGALNTNATTALAGVGASYKVIPTVTTFASAGVETDTNTSNGTYSATGINGLTPVNFNPNPVRTRPTASAGAYYDIVKNQRFGVTGIYRQEAYQAVSSTTVMATYTIGL